MSLTLKTNKTGANTVIARAEDDGDDILFRVSKDALLTASKPSKTGESQGLMLRLMAEFDADIEGCPARVQVSAGRGGAGTWLQLRPFAIAGTPETPAEA